MTGAGVRSAVWSESGGLVVSVGGAVQSFIGPVDGETPRFGYLRTMAHLVARMLATRAEPVVVHFGGAGMSLPRFVAARYPAVGQIVLEPDAALTELVLAHAPLSSPAIEIVAERGEEWIVGMPDRAIDVLVIDAFDHGRVPDVMLTAKFARSIERVLAVGGVVTMNLVDDRQAGFVRHFLEQWAASTRHQVGVALPEHDHFGNYVFVASCDLPFVPKVIAAGALRRWLDASSTRSTMSPEPPTDTLGMSFG